MDSGVWWAVGQGGHKESDATEANEHDYQTLPRRGGLETGSLTPRPRRGGLETGSTHGHAGLTPPPLEGTRTQLQGTRPQSRGHRAPAPVDVSPSPPTSPAQPRTQAQGSTCFSQQTPHKTDHADSQMVTPVAARGKRGRKGLGRLGGTMKRAPSTG